MIGRRLILPVLALMVCGCGSSALPAIPTPPASPKPRPASAHVVAQVDPRLDAVVGRLQAVESLVSQADSLIGSAFAAQSSQLADSARGDLSDARNNLDGARLVLGMVGEPSQYRRADTLLRGALSWYTVALGEGLRDPNRAQDATNRGHTALLQADVLLSKGPEADQLQTIAAKTAALDAASRLIASRTRHVAKKRPSHPRAPRLIASRPLPTPTAQPTATPTATITFKRVPRAVTRPKRTPKQQHPNKNAGSRPRQSRPHPTPTLTATPTPTATPKPSGAAGTTRVATGAAQPTRSTALPHLTRVFSSAFTDVAHATDRIRQCSGYLSSLSSGSDPLGSIKILGCVDRARHRLEGLLRRLAPELHRQASGAIKTSVTKAYSNVLQSKVELQSAKKAVESVRFEKAQSALSAAANHVRAARSALQQAKRALETK